MHPEQPSDPVPHVLSLPRGPVGITLEGPPLDRARRGELPAILAVHGYPGSSRDWRWLAPVLSPAVPFVRVDMPGFGVSPLKSWPGVSLESRGELLEALLDALDLDRVVLLSHSLGASGVLALAARRPERVSHLALLATPGDRPHWRFPQARMRTLGRLLEQPLARAALFFPLRGAFIASGFSRQLSEAERVHTMRCAAAMDFAQHGRNAEAAQAPALVAWAEDDTLVPAELTRELAARLPEGPRLAFPTGGHALQKTRATEIGEALLGWLGVG